MPGGSVFLAAWYSMSGDGPADKGNGIVFVAGVLWGILSVFTARLSITTTMRSPHLLQQASVKSEAGGPQCILV